MKNTWRSMLKDVNRHSFVVVVISCNNQEKLYTFSILALGIMLLNIFILTIYLLTLQHKTHWLENDAGDANFCSIDLEYNLEEILTVWFKGNEICAENRIFLFSICVLLSPFLYDYIVGSRSYFQEYDVKAK